MNVYAYGGPNRENAKISITNDNAPLQTGKTYKIDAT